MSYHEIKPLKSKAADVAEEVFFIWLFWQFTKFYIDFGYSINLKFILTIQ